MPRLLGVSGLGEPVSLRRASSTHSWPPLSGDARRYSRVSTCDVPALDMVSDPQVLPKHTLEALLCGLCSSASEGGYSQGGTVDFGDARQEGRRACVWTELTMPVVTAALNLKPPLSDAAVGLLARQVEAASENPDLQVRAAPWTCTDHASREGFSPVLRWPFL